jgi:hypothetical protein
MSDIGEMRSEEERILRGLMRDYAEQLCEGDKSGDLCFLDARQEHFLLVHKKTVHWGRVFRREDPRSAPLEIAAEYEAIGALFREEVQPVLFFSSLDPEDRILILKLLPIRTVLFEYRPVNSFRGESWELLRRDFYADSEDRPGGKEAEENGLDRPVEEPVFPERSRPMASLTKDELEELLDIGFVMARGAVRQI